MCRVGRFLFTYVVRRVVLESENVTVLDRSWRGVKGSFDSIGHTFRDCRGSGQFNTDIC